MKKVIILLLFLSSQQICAQSENQDSLKFYHQFDFWIGHWDVFSFGTNNIAGESRIESIIDGKGLLENYNTPNDKYVGKSLNKYNPAKSQWEQYWIDNSGLTLFLTGGIENHKMVMSDIENGDSKNGYNKIAWERISSDIVRQTWSVSKDGGITWSVAFDGEYKRRKP